VGNVFFRFVYLNMNTRKRNRHNSTSNYSKVHSATSNDDIRYFIEKMKNKSGSVFSGKKSKKSELVNMPEIFQNYTNFLGEYIKFTLSGITKTYDVIINEWISKKPILVDKIKFVDSSNLRSIISKNISEYAERKLRPGIISSVISRHSTDEEASEIWVNMETYNPPALAFLGPPGTAKTNAITSSLADLAKGGENRLIWDWLRYDITTHEVTTAPFVLPVASDVVTDNPLTTVALMRSTGNREIDMALTENIQCKTLSKAIATFAYILKGGYENRQIELRPEVQQQIADNVVINSLKLETWKFVTVGKIDNNNIDEIIRLLTNSFNTKLAGFKAIVKSVDKFATSNKSGNDWIDYIVNGEYLDQSVKNKHAVAEKYANDFREICHLLSDLIVFGLTPVIAATFNNFFIKELKNSDKESIENGVMYIYHKIHNDYLHRIISRIFLLYALFNINRTQDNLKSLFVKLISILQDGIETMLQEYKERASNNNNQEYYELEKEDKEYTKQISGGALDTYNYYDKFNRFLLKMELSSGNEQHIYRELDILFIKNIVSRFSARDVNQIKNFSATSPIYKVSNIAMNSYDRIAKEDDNRNFSASRLNFADELSIIVDMVNDVDEINRYYSNPQDADLRTTAQRLGDSFGRQFLNFADNDPDPVPYNLSVIFSFINTIAQFFNADAGEIEWEPADYKKEISRFKSSLETLFRKSLSIITNNPKIGYISEDSYLLGELKNKKINIFEIIADYILARLGVVESVYTPGVVYSFPAPIQVFLKKARDSYLKVLNETDIDLNNPTSNVKLPMYVLFIDEILTKLSRQDFTFWLNIWNGLVSPNTDINQAFPPNVCFIVAGNMPADWLLLEQALLQRSSGVIEGQPGDKPKINYGPSTDTLNALGSRINLYIVTYDYSYLMRTDDSAIKKRTNLFITSLVDGVLNNSFSNDSIMLLDTAVNIIGGFYDYYKTIVSKRLSVIKDQNNEELARLHAYIASLTARANVTPYDINKIELNKTIAELIESQHGSNIASATYKDIVTKATKINYLLNSTVLGKSIYKHMFLDYFKSNRQEAIYFKRMIALVLSPVVLHMSFLHAYLTWNNMMRNIADELLNMSSSEFDTDKSSYYTNIMKVLKDSAVIVNKNIATTDKIHDDLNLKDNTNYATDRIVALSGITNSSNYINALGQKKDIRYCHPYVGAFIGLLTIAFYNYIKYMKKFNPYISNSIFSFWNETKNRIVNKLTSDTERSISNTFIMNINNYFIDEDYKRDDVIFAKSMKTSDNAVEIKVVAFDKAIKNSASTISKNVKMPYEIKDILYTDAIAVKIQKTGEGTNDINEDDIKAIKALVEYTFYTYAYKMKNGSINSASLVNYVLGSSSIDIQTPIVRNIISGFFRQPKDGETFAVEALRETDRWFTNVSSSVVRYITIMLILKHILTYDYDAENNTNLIANFINSISNTRIKEDLDSLIREFASLLYKYRAAVFTPLAEDKEFRMFSYAYYEASGTSGEYDGYYMSPRNLINFGDLSFISESLKNKDIIQIQPNVENGYVKEIANKFADNLKEMGAVPTTFLPIHLVSHLDKTQDSFLPKAEVELLSGSITRLVLGKIGLDGIESDAIRSPMYGDDNPHLKFYEISERECERDICGVMLVLSHNLSAIESDKFKELSQAITNLLSINNTIKVEYNKNLIKMLHSANISYDDIQKKILNMDEGIFRELRGSTRKYPKVGQYLSLWDNKQTQEEIKYFFSKLLRFFSIRSANNDASNAIELINALDTYIQKASAEIDNIIKSSDNDKAKIKIKDLLNRINRYSDNLDQLIIGEIQNLIKESEEKYNDIAFVIKQERENIIKYQFEVLSPIIKYSLAIILSNILLALQYGKLEQYLINIDKSFEASYNKVSSDGNYENNNYFDVLVRYIFYDMNRERMGGEGQLIVLDDKLIVETETWYSSGDSKGITLITPVFTASYIKNVSVRQEGNTITGRRVYTQYEYVDNAEGQPRLYCDIHHMPIKGTRDMDGFLHTCTSLMDIASNTKEIESGKARISYHDVMFLKDWIENRYDFAPSNLVNVLLIIGTYLIQNMLLNPNMASELVMRFLPFVITNMYKYYEKEIEADKKNVEHVLENIIKGVYDKPIHPLIAAVALAINPNQEDIKDRLRKDYGTIDTEVYSRKDNFIRDLRLRFYSVQKISGVKYNMYSLYEPGIVIESSETTSPEQTKQTA